MRVHDVEHFGPALRYRDLPVRDQHDGDGPIAAAAAMFFALALNAGAHRYREPLAHPSLHRTVSRGKIFHLEQLNL